MLQSEYYKNIKCSNKRFCPNCEKHVATDDTRVTYIEDEMRVNYLCEFCNFFWYEKWKFISYVEVDTRDIIL